MAGDWADIDKTPHYLYTISPSTVLRYRRAQNYRTNIERCHCERRLVHLDSEFLKMCTSLVGRKGEDGKLIVLKN